MRYCILLSLLSFPLVSRGVTMPDYYRPATLVYKPRIPCNWLFTAQADTYGGSGAHGYDCNHVPTNCLNIYGCENIKDLAQGVPQEVLDKNPGGFLNTLFEQQTGNNFGKIAWNGCVETYEWDFTVWQNLVCGFYLLYYIPFRSVKVQSICFTDFSTPS